MKFIKMSSILILSLFILCAFIPEASARHHRCRSHTSFGLSFNVAPTPSYVVAPAPVAVMPYRTMAPVYPYPYYCAPAPVIIERPAPSVYVQPGFSYSYWRY